MRSGLAWDMQTSMAQFRPGAKRTSFPGDVRASRSPGRIDRMRRFESKVRVLRLLVYNIRYATGTGPAFHLPLPGAGYLRSNPRVLDRITHYLKSLDPDLVGLIEVDTGSVRSGLVNQAVQIAES